MTSVAREALDHWLARKTELTVAKRTELYDLLRAYAQTGISASRAFQQLFEQARARKKAIRIVYDRVRRALTRTPLHQAFGRYLPPAEQAVLYAAEDGGDLVTGYGNAIYIADMVGRMRQTIIRELAYPAALLVAALAIVWMVVTILLPMIESLGNRESWPAVSRSLYDFGTFMKAYWMPLTLVSLSGLTLAMVSLPRWAPGRLRALLDRRIPPYTLYRTYHGAAFLIVLGALIEGGRPIDFAIAQIRAIASPWLARHLQKMGRAMHRGETTASALDTGLLDADLIGLIKTYEEAQMLQKALPSLGKRTVERSLRRIAATSRLLNLLMIVATGALVVWIYGAVISAVGTATLGVQSATDFPT